MCERDVGLFSLIQQVVANVPWALSEDRVPVAYFGRRTAYWTPEGYQGRETVWEYYFEPLVADYPAARIPADVRDVIELNFPDQQEVGYYATPRAFVTNQFGDHRALRGKCLRIPYQTGNPSAALRRRASAIIRDYLRPRDYLRRKANAFFDANLHGHDVIGVHVRGTDAVSEVERRSYRCGSLDLARYEAELARLLAARLAPKVFVATDDEASLAYLRRAFGDHVIAYPALRHRNGEPAGWGPTGRIMPAYIAGRRSDAARNGEEAVIEYFLLTRCSWLVHNGASLAVTVLLTNPKLPHTNTHRRG
jgi:hypothetical protein